MDTRAIELNIMPYEQYLLTPEWQERRAQALERAGNRCQVCYSGDELNVHHRTYERRGNEAPADLTVLCQSCHGWFHRRMTAYEKLTHVTEGQQDLLKIIHEPQNYLVSMGFQDLDRILGRLQQGQFTLIGSRANHGGLQLLMQIGMNAARLTWSVVFFSLTMNHELFMKKLLCIKSGLDISRIQLGLLEDEEWERLAFAGEAVYQLPYWISDAAHMVEDIEQQIEQRLTGDGEVDLIIIDSMDLLETGRKEYPDQRIASVSRSLKLLARKFDIPVVAACQIANSTRVDPRPQLSDVKQAEPYADAVLLLYLDQPYTPDSERRNILDILIAKNQLGPVGEVSLYYDASRSSLRDLEREELASEEARRNAW
jgi:replicative DNA helicase